MHGDSRQKKIIMKTTNNISENKSNIFLSWRWKLEALKWKLNMSIDEKYLPDQESYFLQNGK